jgi:hypothetical protein
MDPAALRARGGIIRVRPGPFHETLRSLRHDKDAGRPPTIVRLNRKEASRNAFAIRGGSVMRSEHPHAFGFRSSEMPELRRPHHAPDASRAA